MTIKTKYCKQQTGAELNTCQAVDCNNIGHMCKVLMRMESGKEEIHDIYLCYLCSGITEHNSKGVNTN